MLLEVEVIVEGVLRVRRPSSLSGIGKETEMTEEREKGQETTETLRLSALLRP